MSWEAIGAPDGAIWFGFNMFPIVKVGEDTHFQYQEGVLDEEQWEGWRWAGQYVTSARGKDVSAGVERGFFRFHALDDTLEAHPEFARMGSDTGLLQR